MIGLLILKILSEIFLSYHDFKNMSVPLFSLMIWGMLSLLYAQAFYPISAGIMVAFVCVIFMGELFFSKKYMGLADKIALPIIAIQIPILSLGDFFMCVGGSALLSAVLWHYLFQSRYFPLLPAIFATQYLLLLLS